MADSKQAGDVGLEIGVNGDTPLPASEGANYFHLARIGREYQLLVGTVNLIVLHEIKEGERSPIIKPEITHRFTLSQMGFAQLKAAVHAVDPDRKEDGQ